MPLERNLTRIDERCPDCGHTLEEDHHDRVYCRECGEPKTIDR